MTIIAGFTSMHAYANIMVTGTFYNLSDLHGSEIIEQNFEAKPHLFWDLKFSDLGNVEIKGDFSGDGTFIIEKIKSRSKPNILKSEESMNNCEECNNIKFLEPQDSGDYDSDIEDGIYKTDNGYWWFTQCEDSWYSGFVHKVIFCPFCGRKIDEQK